MGTISDTDAIFRAATNIALSIKWDKRIGERRKGLEDALARLAKLERLDHLIVEVDDLLKVTGYSVHDRIEALRGLRELRDREIARPVWLPYTEHSVPQVASENPGQEAAREEE